MLDLQSRSLSLHFVSTSPMLPHPVPITQAEALSRLHVPKIQTAFANTPLSPKLSSGEEEQASEELIRK